MVLRLRLKAGRLGRHETEGIYWRVGAFCRGSHPTKFIMIERGKERYSGRMEEVVDGGLFGPPEKFGLAPLNVRHVCGTEIGTWKSTSFMWQIVMMSSFTPAR